MEEGSEERGFQAEEQPLQRLRGVEGHRVMKQHQGFGSSWDIMNRVNEGQELRSQDAKGEEGPLLKTTSVWMSGIPHPPS